MELWPAPQSEWEILELLDFYAEKLDKSFLRICPEIKIRQYLAREIVSYYMMHLPGHLKTTPKSMCIPFCSELPRDQDNTIPIFTSLSRVNTLFTQERCLTWNAAFTLDLTPEKNPPGHDMIYKSKMQLLINTVTKKIRELMVAKFTKVVPVYINAELLMAYSSKISVTFGKTDKVKYVMFCDLHRQRSSPIKVPIQRYLQLSTALKSQNIRPGLITPTIFLCLLRYSQFSSPAEIYSNQDSLHDSLGSNIYGHLLRLNYGECIECFASPLNVSEGTRFTTPFFDIDHFFGADKSILIWETCPKGIYILNPVFDKVSYQVTAKLIPRLAELGAESIFVLISPEWVLYTIEEISDLYRSIFFRKHIVLDKNQHSYQRPSGSIRIFPWNTDVGIFAKGDTKNNLDTVENIKKIVTEGWSGIRPKIGLDSS